MFNNDGYSLSDIAAVTGEMVSMVMEVLGGLLSYSYSVLWAGAAMVLIEETCHL